MEGIVRLLQFGRDPCTPDWSRFDSYFLFHRFYFPVDGEAFITLDTQRFRLASGHAYFIPGLQAVRHECPVSCDLQWLHFDCVPLSLNLRLARLARVIEWPISQWKCWRGVRDTLKGTPSESQELAIHAMTLWGISLLLEREVVGQEDISTTMIHRLEPAVRYIEANYAQVPNLEDLATIVHMSPKYFQRRFQEVFLTTPREYVERCRIHQAEHLLQETGLSIAEIAEAVGYQNPFHFSQVFKKRLGISPRSFRQSSA